MGHSLFKIINFKTNSCILDKFDGELRELYMQLYIEELFFSKQFQELAEVNMCTLICVCTVHCTIYSAQFLCYMFMHYIIWNYDLYVVFMIHSFIGSIVYGLSLSFEIQFEIQGQSFEVRPQAYLTAFDLLTKYIKSVN